MSEQSGEWFWRDVLAAPLPDEPAPKEDVIRAEPPRAAVEGLTRLVLEHDPAALTTLMAALRDPRDGVAVAAANGLGELSDVAAIPRLLKGVGKYPVDYDVPIAVRAAEAAALGRLGSPGGVELTLMILAEGTGLAATDQALQWTRTPQIVFLQELALPGLRALAGDDFGYVPGAPVAEREAAVRRARAWWEQHAERLWATAPAQGKGLDIRIRLLVHYLPAYQLRQVDGARYTLAALGAGVIPYLEQGLASDDDYVRLHVLEVMEKLAGQVGAKDRGRLAVLAAGPLRSDPTVEVAAQAARVCGAAKVPDPLLVALRQVRRQEVVLAVLDGLAATRQPSALPALREWGDAHPPDQRTPDQSVALEAALFACDPQRTPDGLIALLASGDPSVAYPAVDRLVDLTGSDQGVDAGTPPAQRQAALTVARQALQALHG